MRSTIDESGRRRVEQLAEQEFVRRSMDHVAAAPVLALYLYFFSQFTQDHPLGFAVFAVLAMSTAALRVIVGHVLFPTLYGRRPRLTVRFLGAMYLLSGYTWGALGGVVTYLYGFENWTTFFLLVCLAGVCGTVLSGASIFRPYLIAHYVGLCGPTFIASILIGGQHGWTVAFFALIFTGMMWLQGVRRSRVFWSSLEANEFLRKQAQELEEARQRAEEASRAKSDFLANVSHELRTPMNGVLGMTRLALGEQLTARSRDYVETAHDSALALLHLLNDILDFSKIEARKLELVPRDFDLLEVLRGVERLFTNEIRRKNLTFEVDSSAWIAAPLCGDADRLRQVLINLVGNAVKFTDRGSIRLAAATRGQSDQGQEVEFEVTDTGIGIPLEKQKLIFEAFSQVDSSPRRRQGGTGLGLAISAHLVEIMGGRIWVESTPDSGSTFRFTAHFALGDALPAPAPLTPPIAMPVRLRILVAEDHPVNLKLITALLEHEHHEVELANNGVEAIALFEESDFDLVLMDVQMPELDGLEATRRIRDWEQQQGRTRTPIIALTANAMQGDRDRCLAAGMDGYLAKPIEPQALSDLLAAVRPSRSPLPAS